MASPKFATVVVGALFVSGTALAGYAVLKTPEPVTPKYVSKRRAPAVPSRPVQVASPEVVTAEDPVGDVIKPVRAKARRSKKEPAWSVAIPMSPSVMVAGRDNVDLTSYLDKREAVVELTSNAEDIERAIKRRVPMFRDCYEQALKNDRDLRGRVAVNFDIGRSGRVDRVTFEHDSLKSGALKKCIRRRSHAWRFEKPAGGSLRVSVGLAFNAGDSRMLSRFPL